MRRKPIDATLCLLAAMVLAACSGPAATPETRPTAVVVIKTNTSPAPTKPAALDARPTDEAVVAPTPETTATPEAVSAPAWFGMPMTDVNTGASFTLADFHGRVVLVETMAVWCPKCLQQQREVKALHAALGERDDFVSVALDIDPNEDAEILKRYTAQQGFNWVYAVAPAEVAREIAHLYGDQFLNPPSTPMLIIDRQGEVHTLPFGIKNADELKTIVEPLLNEAP